MPVAALRKRGDGRLYEIGRWGTAEQARAWMRLNHTEPMPLVDVGPHEPPFEQWDARTQNERLYGTDMADTRRAQAQEDGRALASALSVVLSPNPDPQQYQAAVFSLGRWFAGMSGYTDVDMAFSYIEGFVGAFHVTTPRQIAPGSTAAANASDLNPTRE